MRAAFFPSTAGPSAVLSTNAETEPRPLGSGWRFFHAYCLLAFLCLLLIGCGGSSQANIPAFREAAEEVGISHSHFNGATGSWYMPEIVGPGGALFDYDSDGDLDVYLVQGWSTDPAKTHKDTKYPLPAGWTPGNRLFRNELLPEGKLRFTDVTQKAGVGHVGQCNGAAVGDYDNDGDLDLFVACYGPEVFYRNNGDGTFSDVTAQAATSDPQWSVSATFADYDRDGDLDLFHNNYLNFSIGINKVCTAPTGGLEYCGPNSYGRLPDRLYRNEGNGRFTEVSESSGVGLAAGPGLGVVAADFNRDGWPDFYVANDGAANFLWVNQRDGTFKEAALRLGAALPHSGLARAGMGVSVADVDEDGDDDIIVTNLFKEGSTLYRNTGTGEFFDTSAEFGLNESTKGSTGFGVGWFDYDNDGLLDLFMANGAVNTVESQAGTPYPYLMKNLLLHNEGHGKRMRVANDDAAVVMNHMGVARGAAFGDIDNDGDTDVLVTYNNGATRLLLNQAGNRRHWLQVKLEMPKTNRFAYGAYVDLLRFGQKPLRRRCQTDSSYIVASDVRLHFGLGDKPRVEGIIVHWPDGSSEKWDQVGIDKLITLRQGTGVGQTSRPVRTSATP